MSQLEVDLGQRLFDRGPRGYALTGAGRRLLAEAEGIRDVSARLGRFADQSRYTTVRITAGEWTSMFVARELPKVWDREANWRPAFMASSAFVDIARREADIGIRTKRPDQPWMAGRQTRMIDMAVYGIPGQPRGFITVAGSEMRSQRWIRAEHADDIVTEVSGQRLAVDLALAGLGQVVLPRFVAPLFPALHQIGPVIDALTQPEWLVSHHDARHDPPIRAALDAIGAILSGS
jgi:DNA-binding transcriptional LysR family regulator